MRILLFALIVPLVVAPTIARAQTDVAPLPMVPETAITADAFVWRFAPPVGSHWTMRSFVRTVIVTETPSIKVAFGTSIKNPRAEPGAPFVHKSTRIQRFVADYDVLSRDALGATTIRLTYREMADDVTTEFKGKSQKQTLERVTAPRPIEGATLTFKQAPDGTIWSVIGGRAFQRRMLESSGALTAAQVEILLEAADSTEATKLVESINLASGLPSLPVRIGESWAYRADLSDDLPRPLEVSGTRTLKSLAPDIALVTSRATLEGDGASHQIPIVPGDGQFQVRYDDVSGSVTGTSRIARSSGLPLETQLSRKFRGLISTPLRDEKGNLVFVSVVRADISSAARVVLEPK